MKPIVVAGAGLGGALLGALLGRAGHRVELLERRSDPRRDRRDVGRSINLALSARGLAALARLGLDGEVLRLATPLYGRLIHPARGALAFQPYGVKGSAIHSISRADLNATLLDAAEAAGNVRIRFGRRVTALDPRAGLLTSVEAEGEGDLLQHPGTVIGADGAYSVIRAALQHRERQDFSQSFLSHGYKELQIPAGPGGVHQLEANALHIWPRGGYMLMAMANPGGSFTVTLYLAFEGANSFAALRTPGEVLRFFEQSFPDALPLLPDLAEAFFRHPVGTLVTMRCRPWHLEDAAALLGDAAHAIVPFFGQGANAAFEDCVALDAALRRNPEDRRRALQEYEAERRPNCDAIAALALANFLEMRDQVASPLFRLEKRGEVLLHRWFPRWFLPLYTMISFTLIPYAAARDRARRQQRAVRIILGFLLGVAAAALWLLLTSRGTAAP